MTRQLVGLLGATGYTGRLVAAELSARGIAHRRAGRSSERPAGFLDAVSGDLLRWRRLPPGRR